MGDPNPRMQGISFKATCSNVVDDTASFQSLPGEEPLSATLMGEYAKGFTPGEAVRVSFDLAHHGGDVGGHRTD